MSRRPPLPPKRNHRQPDLGRPHPAYRLGPERQPGDPTARWWQHIPQPPGHRDRGDTRFDGGYGIYEAPEPWGPWCTVYFTEQWDVGPGEQGEFPTKWMSLDGRTLCLTFSGDDNFCVRKATLEIAETDSA